MLRRRGAAWGVLAAVVLLCVLALPAVAAANVQVVVQGYSVPGPDPAGALTVLGTNAVDDQMTLTFVPNGLGISDDQVVITSTSGPVDDSDGPGTGVCDQVGAAVVCDVSGLPNPVWIAHGFSGNDSITIAGPAHPAYAVWAFGGVGNDTLVGGPGEEWFYGDNSDGSADCYDPVDRPGGTDACNDTIRDGLGNDRINGEGGSDTVEQPALGSAAPFHDEDDFNLGEGSGDTVTYAARSAAHAVTIRMPQSDGIDDDPAEPINASGTPGEEDDLHNGIERVVGTPGNDTFMVGSISFPVRLEGGDGDDTFVAGPGNETFVGGNGVDRATWADPLEWGISGVRATADGVADDGDADLGGEVDNLMPDVEEIVGSSGPDVIVPAASSTCRAAGGAGNDTITGPAGTACTLEGGNGNDTIAGGAGDDVIHPGGSSTSGGDRITFGGGYDVIDYAAATISPSDSTVSGVQASAAPGAVAWCQNLGVGATSARKNVGGQQHLEVWNDAPERIVGTDASDTLCGGTAGTRLEGGDGADTLIGGEGNDVLRGGAGNDLLNGQGGADSVDGEAGNDSVNGGAGPDVVDGGEGDDTHVRGGGGSDVIRGGPGNDVLDEVAFSAIVQGQPATELDAADVLEPGPGSDRIDGAAGDDTIACNADLIGDAVSDSVDGTEVIDCSALPAGLALTVGAGIDRVVGTPFDDVIDGGTLVEGGAGDDVLTGAEAGATLDGGDGTDVLQGRGGADVLRGGTGNDMLRGGGGNDTLDGDSGSDTIAGQGGDDTIVDGSGGDAISGGDGRDSLSYATRGAGVSLTLGGGGADGPPGEGDDVADDVEVFEGTRFDDTFVAGVGSAEFSGGEGNDKITGGPSDDELDGGAGNDTISGGGGTETLVGGAGDDTLVGGSGATTLDGGAGNDKLVAGSGATLLDAGAGNDTLVGGPAADDLRGGAGNDTLDGGTGADVLAGGAGTDTVTYASRKANVVVTVGAKADDGQKGEKDDVRADVEVVVGGRGADKLTGTKGPQTLRGGPGNDTLVGGAGKDALFGDAGNDVLRSKDKVQGETIDGGAGKDSAQVDARDKVKRVEKRLR